MLAPQPPYTRAIMTRSQSFATAMLAIAVLIAVGPRPARSQAIELVVVDVTTVAKGYRTSKLTGSNVVNDHDERIGTIDDIIIGRDRVLFVVLQVGGFLGLDTLAPSRNWRSVMRRPE